MRFAILITSTGTRRVEFEVIAPTGRNISIEEFHIYRLVGGKIVEQWGMSDIYGLMEQLKASRGDKKQNPMNVAQFFAEIRQRFFPPEPWLRH